MVVLNLGTIISKVDWLVHSQQDNPVVWQRLSDLILLTHECMSSNIFLYATTIIIASVAFKQLLWSQLRNMISSQITY